ncbi:MAG: hypothetical protein UX13_C0010G0006 [Candidatus Woesebacteria bacterium GW2011_GWB1_45_5]|uniref:Uncharacterized protein n=1 Tax=Candidatus Woesebacteria bacterium GW2011_GWB1_45_5 TaxID=1618581 RepID=A0A0G1MQ72_9BACT|nr:MAG: hypothetical protein UX13_C0010G0006 [Candidatus Woesebacteria bacterium GW2011_GWB1_45_5]
MRIASAIFLFYCTLVAVFLAVSGLLTTKGGLGFGTQVFFLPVFLYFLFAGIAGLRGKLDLTFEGKKVHLMIAIVLFIILVVFSYLRIQNQ